MAVGSLSFMRSFNEGQTITEVQKFPLGVVQADTEGNRWSYVEFSGAVNAGDWVADTTQAVAATNVLHGNTDAGVGDSGDKIIPVTSSILPEDREYAGAYGIISAGGSVDDMFIIDDVETRTGYRAVHITLINPATGEPDESRGLTANLSNTSALQLSYVGRVATGGANSVGSARGFAQVAVSATQASAAGRRGFGWVQQSGIAMVNKSAAGAGDGAFSLAANGDVLPAAGGTAGRLLNMGDAAGLRMADINIVNNAFRRSYPSLLPVGSGAPALR